MKTHLTHSTSKKKRKGVTVNVKNSSPDRWSKINLFAALRVSEGQTLAEVVGSIYADLGVETQLHWTI